MEKLGGKDYYLEPNLLQEAFHQYPIQNRKIKYFLRLFLDEEDGE
jgi:hypothetical protein